MSRLLPLLYTLVCLPLFAYSASTDRPSHSGYAGESRTDLTDLTLDELFQVEITGSTLTPEKLKTVPSAVSVFSHEELSRMGLDTLNELMNLVPGFQSYRSAHVAFHTPFSSRGRRINPTSSEVLVLMDGQRINEPRTGGITNVAPAISLSNIERVEFIRGPGAAVYGSNAMMGVINIVTRREARELNIGYGSNDHQHVDFLANYEMGELSVGVFGRRDRDDGQSYQVQDTFTPDQVTINDPQSFTDINVKLGWRDTHFNIQHSESKAPGFYNLNRIDNDFNYVASRFKFISLKQDFSWDSVESWAWLSYGRSRVFIDFQLTADGVLAPISAPSSTDPLFLAGVYESAEFLAHWHSDWEIDQNHSLQFGAELRKIDVPESYVGNNFDLAALTKNAFPIRFYGEEYETTVVETSSERDVIGLYGQYQGTFFETSHLTLGLRYDDFSSIGCQVSPRFAWVQEVGDRQSVKLLYGEAFRAPSENELHLTNNPVLLGNSNLKPETVQSYDFIWVGNWSSASVSFGYFENHFQDSIEQALVDGALQFTNLSGDDHTRGYEFEASYQVNDNLFLRGTYTHITDKPDTAFREADQLGSFTVNYQEGKWNANLVGSYHDSREMLTSSGDRLLLDSYCQVYGKLSYSVSEKWDFYIKGKNLFDANIASPPSFPTAMEGTPGRGREIMAGVVVFW